jgi:hypothetical protein
MSPEHDHILTIANDRLEKIRRLEREIESWRQVAGQLHAALIINASSLATHPASRDSDKPADALEAYARLQTHNPNPLI